MDLKIEAETPLFATWEQMRDMEKRATELQERKLAEIVSPGMRIAYFIHDEFILARVPPERR